MIFYFMAAKHPATHHPSGIQRYRTHLHELDTSDLIFPLSVCDIPTFENANEDISVCRVYNARGLKTEKIGYYMQLIIIIIVVIIIMVVVILMTLVEDRLLFKEIYQTFRLTYFCFVII